jgi:hypothetical protein
LPIRKGPHLRGGMGSGCVRRTQVFELRIGKLEPTGRLGIICLMLYETKLSAKARQARRQMASEVKKGASVEDVANRWGVHVMEVKAACVAAGVRLPGLGMPSSQKVTRQQWAATDWNLRDVDIARMYGLSRERVRQVRKMLRRPRSKFYRMRHVPVKK